MSAHKNIILVGNPNSGKTSLFNALTGLNQKVGNFPGVTVEKKSGTTELEKGTLINIIDLPGMYSIYPKRQDEWVGYNVIMGQEENLLPDLAVVVVDASNLKRNLLLCSQLIDLKIPVVAALTMLDIAHKKDIAVDSSELERQLGVAVVEVNPRKNKGINELKKRIQATLQHYPNKPDFCEIAQENFNAVHQVKNLFTEFPTYKAQHYLINYESFKLTDAIRDKIKNIEIENKFNTTKTQAEEVLNRFKKIRLLMQSCVVEKDPLQKTLYSQKLDKIFLHRKWGYLILIAVLFLVFQSIFLLAEFPMNAIESLFAFFADKLNNFLPNNVFTNLLINGILPGLSGIFVFVPQIMILFFLLTVLEDTGYMSRISFLTDKLMRKVGISGKSVMPLVSGMACAVPAIMSTRSIESKKEKLLSILVTPLMSCSARLPVYTILIALVIPNKYYFGFISLKGLVLTFMYLFGTAMALIVSWVFSKIIHIKEKSFFILELPDYRAPRWGNAILTMLNKAKIFIWDAGKIIIIISIILWGLSNYGPSYKMDAVHAKYKSQQLTEDVELKYKSELLENSYAGHLGRFIEPAIKPLGYDWRIGIALITSFAAREVFVGTMATLYSNSSEDEEYEKLLPKMQQATWPDGKLIYTLATGVSLLLFYALAMQCISTLTIVYRETKSLKWPIIQFAYMTILAYLVSFFAYQILS